MQRANIRCVNFCSLYVQVADAVWRVWRCMSSVVPQYRRGSGGILWTYPLCGGLLLSLWHGRDRWVWRAGGCCQSHKISCVRRLILPVLSFWNFAQTMAMSNFKTVRQLCNKLWTYEISRYLSLRWISEWYHILQQPPACVPIVWWRQMGVLGLQSLRVFGDWWFSCVAYTPIVMWKGVCETLLFWQQRWDWLVYKITPAPIWLWR